MKDAPFCFPDLEGRTLLITGITSGIGRALLPSLLEQGLNILGVSRGRAEMDAVRQELGAAARLRLYECDLSDPSAVARTARSIAESGVALDAILHNAAIDPRQSFESSAPLLWSQVLQVNLLSAVTLTQALLPLLRCRSQGRIIHIGSIVFELGAAYLGAYAASKGAVIGLTRSLAHELKGSGITVNCVVPGAIQVEKEVLSDEDHRKVIAWQSVPRRLVPADLLGPICLLLSGAGSAITGQTLTVDGGIIHPMADAPSQAALADPPLDSANS